MPRTPAPLEIIRDSREQRGWTFGPEVEKGEVVLTRATMKTGDYGLLNPAMRDLVAIERKSLGDIAGCVGHGRERFRRQMERLSKLRWPLLIVEASIQGIAEYKSRAHECDSRQIRPAHIIGCLMSWSAELRVPWLAGGSVRQCERLALVHLRAALRMRERELKLMGSG